jgi:hypothetical protein
MVAVLIDILKGAYKGGVLRAVRLLRALSARSRLRPVVDPDGPGSVSCRCFFVLFIESVFQIALLVAITAATVHRDLVEAALTLGGRDDGISPAS